MNYLKLIILFLGLVFVGCNSDGIEDGTTLHSEIVSDTIIIKITDTIRIPMEAYEKDEYFILERLPLWVLQTKLIRNNIILDKYEVDVRLNPFHLEDDFNGDSNLDIALPIKEISSGKIGIAVIHGETHTIEILGAGKEITEYRFNENEEAWADDLQWINIWLINRNRINLPGTDLKDSLILELPSIQIEKSEVGGGQIFWNKNHYSYFHQTC